MKTRKAILCLLCIISLLLTMSGCALNEFLAESKDDVLLRLTQYIDGREPTSANVTMDFGMTSQIGEESTNITVSLSSRVLMASETDSYAEADFSYTINDLEVHDSAQVYNFAEDGKLLTFTYSNNADLWFRTESALPEQQPVPTPVPTPATEGEESEIIIPEVYHALILEEGTHAFGDVEAYVLTKTLSGEECISFLQNSPILDALTARLQSAAPKGSDLTSIDLKSLDFSHLSADVTLYIDKESGAPIQMEATLSGMNMIIADLMGMLPQQTTDLLGTSVTMEPIRIILDEIGFDPVTIPEVTEEARILATQETFNPDQGNGTYILQQHGDAIQITAQKGWSVSELGYCFAGFHNPERTRSAFYELYLNITGEDFIALVESGMIPAMEAHDLTVVTAAGDPIGEYRTYSITGDAVNVYLAYRTVGDSLLGIYAEDSSGASLASVLTPILEGIENYQMTY